MRRFCCTMWCGRQSRICDLQIWHRVWLMHQIIPTAPILEHANKHRRNLPLWVEESVHGIPSAILENLAATSLPFLLAALASVGLRIRDTISKARGHKLKHSQQHPYSLRIIDGMHNLQILGRECLLRFWRKRNWSWPLVQWPSNMAIAKTTLWQGRKYWERPTNLMCQLGLA